MSRTSTSQARNPHGRQTRISDPTQSVDQGTFELQDVTQESDTQVIFTEQLPPVDGGVAAWRLLLAAFIFEALFWGFPSAFGVFQNYYTSLPSFGHGGAASQVALIGTLTQAMCYMGAPLSALVTRRFGRYHKYQIWAGWAMCIAGLLTASFADSVAGLVGTQGVLYGLGFVVLTYPIISMVDEWWVARKGMAFGLISAASGATGIVMPFILEAMLKRYGYRVTLRASAVTMVVLTVPLLPLLKGRLPAAASATLARTDWSFVREPLFWVYALATLIQGMGFFIPAVFLPSYATVIGLDSTKGALLLAIMSIAQVLGQFAFGYLSDKNWSVSLLAAICSVVASAAAFAFWGLGKSLALLMVFSLLYGFFGYAFGTMRVAMGKAVSKDPSAAVVTYAIFVFLQGVGNVLVSPISAGLMFPTTDLGSYAAGLYGPLVLFTGSSLLLSAVAIWLFHSFSFAVKKLSQ